MTAVSADSVVVDLIARTDNARSGVTRYVSEFESGMGRVNRAATSIEASTGRAANASRNLGRQVADIGTQVAGGQSPFLIIAQQVPQIADALADTEGKLAKFASFLSGPLGAAMLAVASIAGVLAGKLLEGGDAADRKHKAVDGLKEAVDRLNGAAASANHTTEQGILDDINAAEALRQREIRTRRQIQAELDLAKARLSAAQVSERYNPVGIPGQGAASRGVDVASLDRQIAEQNAKIAEADRAIRTGRAQIVLRQVAAATDAATAATTKYGDEIDRLTRKFETGGFGKGQAAENAFKAQAKAATDARDATLKAITDGRRAQTKATNEALAEARRAAKERAKIEEALRNPGLGLDLAKDNRSMMKTLGLGDADKEFDAITAEIQKVQRARVDAMDQAIEEQQRPAMWEQFDRFRHGAS